MVRKRHTVGVRGRERDSYRHRESKTERERESNKHRELRREGERDREIQTDRDSKRGPKRERNEDCASVSVEEGSPAAAGQ